ncbi:MAG: sugar nucleotide-binding protein, partial [Acidimicrobiaceae bacterium]|nr:sugar nucleotide-binding protein [Acidimicrobiaceae bacterium]
KPSLVVNCAAWTDVDGCEGDHERAQRINAMAVGYLSEAAEEVGAHLVQVSTDFVFDGEADVPYREDHPTGPLSVYGAVKLAGEVAAGPSATVVRTSWLQPADAPGMVERLIVALASGGPVRMGDERVACPTFVADLVPVLRYLGEERVAGVVHATNGGSTSWFGFAREVATAAGLDPGRISRTADPGLDGTLPARRPPFSALDNGVLRALGRPAIRHHGDAIAEAVARAVG